MDDALYPSDHTYQEIMRQQEQWKVALQHLEKQKEFFKDLYKENKDKTWVFTGCGTSYYLAQTASAIFEMISGISCKAVPSSEILLFPSLVFNPNHNHLLVPISRSGTSTEVVQATQKVRIEFSIASLAVSCNPNSTLIGESKYKLTFPFEQEDSVVMTGSFTTMLLSITFFAALVAEDNQIIDLLLNLPEKSKQLTHENEEMIQEIARNNNFDDFIFLGQGPFYGIANEAGLKIQEMAITIPQSFHTLEYRHGPMSTVTHKSLITIIYSENSAKYNGPFVRDMKKLGATILAFMDEKHLKNDLSIDFNIGFPSGFGDNLNVFFVMPLLQLFGYYKAVSKNIDPDNPRNLSAVVTFDIMGNG
ncbi:MAG: SIS domain-containing protein [Calditrichaeota bacterium]|nr:SIS domain-containing protein [Calditrichota bacterium]